MASVLVLAAGRAREGEEIDAPADSSDGFIRFPAVLVCILTELGDSVAPSRRNIHPPFIWRVS
jgi:hypothetical protein